MFDKVPCVQAYVSENVLAREEVYRKETQYVSQVVYLTDDDKSYLVRILLSSWLVHEPVVKDFISCFVVNQLAKP